MEAALDRLLSTEEARWGITIALVADVAQAYFELLAFDERLRVVRAAAKSYADTLSIFRERLEGGKASILSTSRAEGSYHNADAQIHDLTRAIAETEDEIGVLLGRTPAPVPRGAALFEQRLVPQIQPGLPSRLLERRPDIRSAELEVKARNAEVGAAIAEYFPRVGLGGLLGKVTPESGFSIGSSTANLWSLAATLSGPIYQGGRLSAQESQRRAETAEALLH